MLKLRFDTAKFNKDLESFIKHEQSSLDETVKVAADQIKNDTNALDSDVPVVAGSTTVSKIDQGYQINKGGGLGSNEPLAAYSEFGTGDYAKILLAKYPKEWVDMARNYYVNGMGRLPARPALYPSFNRATTNIAQKAAENIGK